MTFPRAPRVRGRRSRVNVSLERTIYRHRPDRMVSVFVRKARLRRISNRFRGCGRGRRARSSADARRAGNVVSSAPMRVMIVDQFPEPALAELRGLGLDVDYRPGIGEAGLRDAIADAAILVVRSTAVKAEVIEAAKSLDL